MTVKTATRAAGTAAPPAHGAVIEIPLNRLKASPANVRKTVHASAAVEALAASIAAKGVLQAPTVAPERDPAGEPTGWWLVTIGEGRRQALDLLARRKTLKKTHAVRCVVDLENDPAEISLDENVTRSDMHPADQFEAFRDLAERLGWGAEEIGARFGVSAQVVRQRLRLAAVCPALMAGYRAGDLTLDQLMAFAVSEDHARQAQVWEQLPPWNRHPSTIRRAMLEAKVPARDRRAIFVGVEAYEAAGGTVLRDLFTEDDAGWLEDVALLDRLTLEKLTAEAERLRAAEGWTWAEAHLDFPHAHGLGRAYPAKVERSEEEQSAIQALADEYDALVERWQAVEDLPPDVEARLKEIDAGLEAFGDGYAYHPGDLRRGGVFVVLGHDGAVRIERGFIRPEDERPQPEAETDAESARSGDAGAAGSALDAADEEDDGAGPLSAALVMDLTARRTESLRDALAACPPVALIAVVHALALATFYPPYDQPTPLGISRTSTSLGGLAKGIGETPAGRRIADRHEGWARRMPKASGEAWDFVASLASGELLDLLAHCAALTLNAVHVPYGRNEGALALADRLATLCELDMAANWAPTEASYLGRVRKAHILEAVREAVGEAAAGRIAGLKKAEMAMEAETLLAGTGWLPPLLRTAPAEDAAPWAGPGDEADDRSPAAEAVAAE